MSAAAEPGGRPYRGLAPEDRRAQRRERLLEAALDLFAADGYAVTRIDALCRRAGVTTRHFYELFPSREDLLLALYDRITHEHLAGVAAALEGDPGAFDATVRRAVHAGLGAWAADERRARLAFVEVVGVSERVEDHRLATIEVYARTVAGALQRAADAGTLPSGEFAWRARAIVGAVIEVIVLWLHRRDRPPFEEVADELADLFLGGLRPAASAAAGRA